MSLVRAGIENVRVLVLPDGVTADGQCAAVSRAALVAWHSSLEGMYYQAYVNGRFAGATLDAEQRQLVIHAPSSFQAAVRVEIVAVEPKDAHSDHADEIELPAAGTGRIRLTILRGQSLPVAATANVYFDNGTGQVDYTTPLNSTPIPIWPYPQDKAGFGMTQFGAGDFGYDAAAAVGFSKGSFGYGQFGLDADVVEWISPTLPLGRYRLGVRIADARSNEGPASETEPIPVIPAARPAAGLEVATWDEQTNRLTLRVLD
jgi:hypothetical protein